MKKRKKSSRSRGPTKTTLNLRMPGDLHQRLRKEAWNKGRSLNEEIVTRLNISVTSPELEFSVIARDHLARLAGNVLKQEVQNAIDELRKSFRDGPVMVNQALTILARDILHHELETVIVALRDAQLNNARNAQEPGHA